MGSGINGTIRPRAQALRESQCVVSSKHKSWSGSAIFLPRPGRRHISSNCGNTGWETWLEFWPGPYIPIIILGIGFGCQMYRGLNGSRGWKNHRKKPEYPILNRNTFLLIHYYRSQIAPLLGRRKRKSNRFSWPYS